MTRAFLRVLALASVTAGCSHGTAGLSGVDALEELPSSPVALASPPEAPRAPGGETAVVEPCGRADQRDCPLQAWMKANMAQQALRGDAAALEQGFATLAESEMPGYADWQAIARAAGHAARGGDLDAARRGCKQCHDAYRARYRRERRSSVFR